MSQIIDIGAGVRLERAIPCTMRDGTILLADHYYPPQPGPNPTLLMRQPYGRDIASTVVYAHPAWFARHGYNIVIQDVRGRGGSEGDFYPFRHEQQDGVDTIAAIRQRPECNGDIGMYGFSYQGATQLLAAAAQPEGLRCIAPAMTACDLFHGWFYQNGALRLASTMGWGLQMLKEDARRRNLPEASDLLERAWASLSAQFLHTPYAQHPVFDHEQLPTYLRDWIEHDTPGDYWHTLDTSQQLDRITIPALHLSGWYDTYLSGSIGGFVSLTRHAPNQYLIAGPWVHIPWGDRIGPNRLGPEANLDTDALLLRWFNHWLKGTGEFAPEPRIRHFALGENRWHTASEWPGKPTHTLFLHSQGRANSSKSDGTLATAAPTIAEPPDLYIYDPEVPVPAPGGLANASGPTDQATLELGNNFLCYTTAPIAAALHVFGSPEATLYATTSAPNADLVAKLVHLKPTGEATFLCLGICRATVPPDTPHLWHFTLDPTSCVFAPGDRVRLEIASSAFPLFDRNPGNATPPRDASPWNWQRSTQILFHDAEHPSALHLPLTESLPA